MVVEILGRDQSGHAETQCAFELGNGFRTSQKAN